MRNLITTDSMFYLNKELWDDVKEYKEDYKAIIRARELNRIPFMHQSPQYTHRRFLVEYMKKICIEKEFSHCCLHLAVYILDIFMDNHSIVVSRLQLTANVCLLLAGKFEENAVNALRISDLTTAANGKYPLKDYLILEIQILRFFDWYIMFPTAAHYTHYYMQAMISNRDLRKNENPRTLIYDLHYAVAKYLDMVIDDIHFMQHYKPSILAAAIIAASRKELGLIEWTKELTNFTEYSKVEILEPMDAINKNKFSECIQCKYLINPKLK